MPHPALAICKLSDGGPTAAKAFSPVPLLSCSPVSASPNFHFVLPAIGFPVYISACASLAKQNGLKKKKKPTKKPTSKQTLPQAAAGCVPPTATVRVPFNSSVLPELPLMGSYFQCCQTRRAGVPAGYSTGKEDFGHIG